MKKSERFSNEEVLIRIKVLAKLVSGKLISYHTECLDISGPDCLKYKDTTSAT